MADDKSDDTTETARTSETARPSDADRSPTTDAGKAGATPATRGRSGNPAKATAGRTTRQRKPKDELRSLDDPISARAYRSPRFLAGLVLVLGGIAWMAWYYAQVRPGSDGQPGSPAFMADLERWNYAIGFGAILVGLVVMAHRSTPLGRGRGVVVGMLGCFLIGLVWICTFYVFTNDISGVPLMNDLGQFNLVVGIAFMAVGFTYATKWE